MGGWACHLSKARLQALLSVAFLPIFFLFLGVSLAPLFPTFLFPFSPSSPISLLLFL
jgi:hypothetical protein